MKPTFILSAAMAAFVAAAPQGLDTRTDGNGGNGGPCNAVGTQVCCNGLLTCLVQALGAPCSNQAFCCNVNSPVVRKTLLLLLLNLPC